ncbi:uncharacterized protein LOC127720635 isoform X5 [Mytilus californianus]|uniref:uncharacterized protein LOC127720635 isoform X5 n=1 Tax=Mytilus californianus TaxID=6549 RepID=UPI00224686B2|nr:uncharacterized protein LOC127720635 isoform X5 [Mytilus californianus]
MVVGCNFFPDLPRCKGQFGPSIGGVHSAECKADLKECSPGHEMLKCKGTGTDLKYYCQQCSDTAFQPNANRYGDRCRLRKACLNQFMRYRDYGSTTRDAMCKCEPGYHFESTDQRACVQNNYCDRGYGQTDYGSCERCVVGSTYSDKKDKLQRCKTVTNCEKDKRCTIKRSNGTGDNVCSTYRVKNPSKDCANPPPVHARNEQNGGLSEGAIAGIVLGVLAIIVIVVLLFLFLLHRRRKARAKNDQIDPDHLERLASQIVERSAKEEPYRRKVLTASMREIEDNINKQIWSLPQELFRNHFQDAKYELVVEKYKDKDHKYAINGYMQDWREWREEAGDAVQELFACLKKVKREDIIYKICSKFREAYPEVVIDAETQLENGVVSRRSKRQNKEGVMDVLFPCCSAQEKYETEENEQVKFMLDDSKDAAAPPQTLEFEPNEKGNNSNDSNDNGALTPQEAGDVYRERPTPSAPVLDDSGNIHIIIPMNRSVSYPVQASS